MPRLVLCVLLLLSIFFNLEVARAQSTPTPSPTPATHAILQDTEFKFGGEIRERYEDDIHGNAQSTDVNGKAVNNSQIKHRLKIVMDVRKGENLQAGVTLLNVAVWGERPATGDSSATDPESSQIPGSRSGTGTSDNLVLVNRAWGWWKATDGLAFKFGRMGVEFADGSVFSENDWEQVPVSQDGVLALWDSAIGHFTFFGIKNDTYSEYSDGSTAQGIDEFDAQRVTYGLNLDVRGLPSFLKMVSLHVMQIFQDEISIPVAAQTTDTSRKENNQRLGMTIGGDTGPYTYKLSGAYSLGKEKGNLVSGGSYNRTINAWMTDASLGYALTNLWGLKIIAGAHIDSGNRNPSGSKDQHYGPLYYDRHFNGGLMDVLRWGNLTYYEAGMTVAPRDDIEGGLLYHWFEKTTSQDGTVYGQRYRLEGLGQPSTGVTSYAKTLGGELDLYSNKSFEADAFKVGARLGAFFPGSAIKNSTIPESGKTIYELFAQASFVF
jgi:hypothetical protein